MNDALFVALVGLQAVQVAILWLHDWLPLPPLNDVAAVRGENGFARLALTTVLQSAPYTVGLAATLASGSAAPLHGWVRTWLWISYGLLFAGELQAWWIPYARGTSEARTARYAEMFGRTHAFLPARHGITPNTLHAILHACTAATLILLALTSF